MLTVKYQDGFLNIYPVTQNDREEILEVYKQCEDFLALGPVATASVEMVLADLEISRDIGGRFCGIHAPDGKMIGVIDYVPNNYRGENGAAYLSLLMISLPYRNLGIGVVVVRAVEDEIKKDESVTVIWAGVQVNNPKAIRFWQRMGYRIASEPKLYPDQTTAVDLRKDIR